MSERGTAAVLLQYARALWAVMCLQSNPGLPRNVVQAGWEKIVIARLNSPSQVMDGNMLQALALRVSCCAFCIKEKSLGSISRSFFGCCSLRIRKEENSDLQTILCFCHRDIATPIENEACPRLHDPISGADSDDLAPSPLDGGSFCEDHTVAFPAPRHGKFFFFF